MPGPADKPAFEAAPEVEEVAGVTRLGIFAHLGFIAVGSLLVFVFAASLLPADPTEPRIAVRFARTPGGRVREPRFDTLSGELRESGASPTASTQTSPSSPPVSSGSATSPSIGESSATWPSLCIA